MAKLQSISFVSNVCIACDVSASGKGVNIVLDCVGGSMYETNVNVLAMDGRWIVYGLLGKLC